MTDAYFTGTVTAPEFAASGRSGSVAPTRYVGRVDGGPPTAGTFQVGDFVIDATTPAIWICRVAGSPGSWSAAGSGSVPSAGPAYNVLSQNLPHFRRAVARVRAGIAPGVLFCVGDSTTNAGTVATFAQSYPSLLTAMINSHICSCAQTWTLPKASGVNMLDLRVTIGTNFSVVSNGQFNWWQNFVGTTGTLTYVPCGSDNGPASVDTVDIYYVANSGYGSFTVDIGGSTLQTINCNNSGVATITKVTVALGSAGTPTINIKGPTGSGSVIVLAMNAYLSTNPVLQVANMGIGGSTAVGQWNQQAAVYYFGFWATQFSPDLSIIDLGINDAVAASPPQTYAAAMQTIITEGLTSGDVILKSMVPSGTTGLGNAGAPIFEAEYVQQLIALSNANNVPLLDGFDRWVNYASSNGLGYMHDALHPTPLGFQDVAAAVFDALRLVV